MISKEHRFHGYHSLRFVYRNGQTVRGPLCSLKYVANPRRKEYRLGVVVPRKVNKSAVVRNRIRRRIYETFRAYEPRIKDPYDLVVTVFHDNIKDISSEELDRLVRAHLQEAGILKGKSN